MTGAIVPVKMYTGSFVAGVQKKSMFHAGVSDLMIAGLCRQQLMFPLIKRSRCTAVAHCYPAII